MKEVAAGGVVYTRRNGNLFILMIEDRFGNVTLAKGKQEPGETLEETALREIAEETGVSGELIDKLQTVAYTYVHPQTGEQVEKEVHYYLVEALSEHLSAQTSEIHAASWYSPAEARQLQQSRGYANNHVVLAAALRRLGWEA